MRVSVSRLFALPLVACAMVATGCSDDSSAPPVTSASAESIHPSTSRPTPGDTELAPGAAVLRFDAPGDISCTSETALVEVSYATRDIDAVGFVVDGSSVQTAAAPPAGATIMVPVPCDGRVHTIMLVGSGAGGPAFASKAVVTRPA